MKTILFCLTILAVAHLSYAAVSINGGVNLGQFAPHDDLVTETFNDDFYFEGFVAFEGDNGLELLLSLGRYSDTSHHPDDLGFDAALKVTPFSADVCYLFFRVPTSDPTSVPV